MSAQSYSLVYDGYWREPDISSLPTCSGVYSVYACTYDAQSKTVSLRLLIYIGEAENVNERVAGHEKWDQWRGHLGQGEQICFSVAPVASSERSRVEAALIFHHKPPANEEYKDRFPFDQTTIATSGRNTLMSANFTVYRTE